MLVMAEENSWTNLFLSGNCPEFVKSKVNGEIKFRPFRPEVESWILADLADKSRPTNEKSIQVFWLGSNGCRKYIGKVVS